MSKPTIYRQSQLLFRRSYKPQRGLRVRPARKLGITFHPAHRFTTKPVLVPVP